jgi:predicted membrane-bound dolichyl-phosphate-mannose-protein mannosyltransferase
MLAGNPLAWHWSSPHPEGFAYEWTHPPLAKEIMAGSMGIFGVTPLAWRLPGALLGVLVIFGVYLVAKKLFGSRDIAVLAAFFISMDGLLFTMSRIGTADIYFIAAAVMSYYFFLAKRDFWSALFLGFAAAAKWSTLWFLPILALTWVILRRKITPGLLWFFVIPPIIYFVSYLPMFYFGHDFSTFWGMQKQMWWYHSGLVATHPYTSPWWQWPLMIRPVYLYQNYKDGIISNIYAIGNPFFFWMGIVALGISIISFIRQRRLTVFLLIFSYLVLFAPWAASPRIMFLYHYLPSLPFLAIILAMVLKKMNWIIAPSVVILIAFIYFYPHWSGMFVPEWWDKTYYWLRSWR